MRDAVVLLERHFDAVLAALLGIDHPFVAQRVCKLVSARRVEKERARLTDVRDGDMSPREAGEVLFGSEEGRGVPVRPMLRVREVPAARFSLPFDSRDAVAHRLRYHMS